jgi:hypothetical protein
MTPRIDVGRCIGPDPLSRGSGFAMLVGAYGGLAIEITPAATKPARTP